VCIDHWTVSGLFSYLKSIRISPFRRSTMRKSYRVKKEAEFQTVFTKGKSCANRQFVVYMLEKPGQVHFRVGISVGKKIGNAVARNWVKRRIRQTLTDLKPQLKQDCDFLVIA